jgi:ATP-dependent exoDNAse (exonuclease V) alpha subunit
MISEQMYGFIQDAIEEERVKAVLFVGDHYQLLPVDSGKNNIFSIRHQYKLNEIVRQAKDSYIIKIASAAREIIKNKQYPDIKTFFTKNMDSRITFFHNQEDFLKDFCASKDWYAEDKVIASYRNGDVDSYNRLVRKRYWLDRGVDNIPTLLEGDKVVFQNAYSIGGVLKYSNNEQITLSYAKKKYFDTLKIGYWECKDSNKGEHQELIRIIDPDSTSIFNDKLKKIAKIARNEKYYENRKKMWKTFFEFKGYFADVKYTFASTIHKLQGSTYETVYIDLFNLANNKYINYDEIYRLVYVAITRASKDIKILIPTLEDRTMETLEKEFKQLFGKFDL